MSTAAVKLDHSIDEVLEDICERGQAAEIHYWDRTEPRTARTQLIELGDNTIRIAKPQCIGREVIIPLGTKVTIYFPYSGEIMAFETTMMDPTVLFELNKQKKIVGVEIQRPKALLRQQRRHDYRITLARYHVNVELHEATIETDIDYAFSTPIPARRMKGRMTNISASGFGMIVQKQHCVPFKLWDLFMACFQLPEMDETIWVPAQIRHARRIHDGEDVQIGVRIAHQDHPDIRLQVPLLRRFITSEQRRQIQTKKG